MAFIVVFQTEGRESACAQHGTLTDAVQFVEQLRNERGIDDARIFRADEVPFDFRPYFRVEIGSVTSGPPRPSRHRIDGPPAAPEDPAALDADRPACDTGPMGRSPNAAAGTNRRGLFGR